MYSTDPNNNAVINAQPITLNSEQAYDVPFTTTENTFNYIDNNAQDSANQYITSENNQNYETVDNNTFQNYSTATPITTTENFNLNEGYQIHDQNFYQSTPITNLENTPLTTSSEYIQGEPTNYIQSTDNIIEGTPITTTTNDYQNYENIYQSAPMTTTTDFIQNTPITTTQNMQVTTTTTTTTTQNYNQDPTITTSPNYIQTTPITQNIYQSAPIITTQKVIQTTNQIPQTVNQVPQMNNNQNINIVNQQVQEPKSTSPTVKTNTKSTTQEKQTVPPQTQQDTKPVANVSNASNNSHFVSNYPIFENDPRRVAFYNNKVKVYNTYRLVKPVPIEKLTRMSQLDLLNYNNNLSKQIPNTSKSISLANNNSNSLLGLDNVKKDVNNLQSGLTSGINNIQNRKCMFFLRLY